MNIVGERLEKYVSEQIKTRQKIYGSINRSIDQLQYLNSRNAFVKLVSSVDIVEPEAFLRNDQGSDIYNIVKNYSGPKLAQRFVLYNGVTDTISNIPKAGIPTDNSLINDSAYGLGGLTFGYRPMPGIISADIKTENRGSLKTAIIKIKAWNRTQFEIVDLLYLRLGYTILLEWGNTIYFRNNTNSLYKENPLSIATEFLNSPLNYQKVLAKIQDNRRDSDGNYDALYGKVVNYEWNFAEDGSYDITLTVRSIGDVIESLKVNILTNTRRSLNKVTEETAEETPSIESYADKHLIGQLFYEVTKELTNTEAYKDRYSKSAGTLNNYLFSDRAISTFRDGTMAFKSKITNNNISREYTQFISAFYANAPGKFQYYIRLGTLLEYLQEVIIPYYKTSDADLNALPVIKFDTDVDTNLAYYNYLQISSDPRICLINTQIKTNQVVNDSNYNNAGINIVNEPIYYFYGSACDPYVDQNYKAGKIMNIYFNFLYILELIDSNTDEEGRLSLIDFLKGLCGDASKALGSLNIFEPFVDEITNTIKIIDQAPLPNKEAILKELQPGTPESAIIDLYGYYKREKEDLTASFVRNFGIKTELNSAFASTITIGAQAAGYVVGEDATALSRLNRGLIDRIVPIKVDASDRKTVKTTSTTPEEKFAEAAKNLYSFIFSLGTKALSSQYSKGFSLGSLPKWNEADMDSYSTLFKNYLKYKEAVKATQNKTASGNIGFLPISINLTLDGISGIKIYNAIKIDISYLPSNYPETMDFIITGVSHKIQNNLWVTDLSTIMVPNQTQLNNSNELPDAAGGPQTLSPALSSTPPGISSRDLSRITGLDPALTINPSKVGSLTYGYSPLAKKYIKLFNNGQIIQKNLVSIGIGNFKLVPEAASAFKRWKNELDALKIPYTVSSAYRSIEQQTSLANSKSNKGTVSAAGSSPHGWGGAIDFSNLYVLVGGSGAPGVNTNARIQYPIYKQIADIGAKYGWYNPWRLSDNSSVDEIWHFEYWGNV